MTLNKNLICIGAITKAHGIVGDAKIISFAEKPEDIFKYPKLYDDKLNEYVLKKRSTIKEMFIVRLSKALADSDPKLFTKLTMREEIEQLAGTQLYITKDMLSDITEGEYYYEDLKGLEVRDSENKPFGSIIEARNFGGGDLLEVMGPDLKDSIYLPFSKEFIIEINLEEKYLLFDFIKAGI
jgi:16S rRNA processing protein RimM